MKLMGWQSVVLASKQQRAASNNQEVVEKKKKPLTVNVLNMTTLLKLVQSPPISFIPNRMIEIFIF